MPMQHHHPRNPLVSFVHDKKKVTVIASCVKKKLSAITNSNAKRQEPNGNLNHSGYNPDSSPSKACISLSSVSCVPNLEHMLFTARESAEHNTRRKG